MRKLSKKIRRAAKPYVNLTAFLLLLILGSFASVNWYFYEQDLKKHGASLVERQVLGAGHGPEWKEDQPLHLKFQNFCQDAVAHNYRIQEYLYQVNKKANPEAKKIFSRLFDDIVKANKLLNESCSRLSQECSAKYYCEGVFAAVPDIETAQLLQDNVIKRLNEMAADRFYPEEEIKSDTEKLKLFKT